MISHIFEKCVIWKICYFLNPIKKKSIKKTKIGPCYSQLVVFEIYLIFGLFLPFFLCFCFALFRCRFIHRGIRDFPLVTMVSIYTLGSKILLRVEHLVARDRTKMYLANTTTICGVRAGTSRVTHSAPQSLINFFQPMREVALGSGVFHLSGYIAHPRLAIDQLFNQFEFEVTQSAFPSSQHKSILTTNF